MTIGNLSGTNFGGWSLSEVELQVFRCFLKVPNGALGGLIALHMPLSRVSDWFQNEAFGFNRQILCKRSF